MVVVASKFATAENDTSVLAVTVKLERGRDRVACRQRSRPVPARLARSRTRSVK